MKDPDAITAEQWQAQMARRVAEQAARVEAEMARRGERFIPRGRATQVVRNDGQVYESVSFAAIANRVHKPDNICQAIKRKGECAGWYWAYKGKEPKGFYSSHVVQAAVVDASPAFTTPTSSLPTPIPTPSDHTECWPRYKSIGNPSDRAA